ncbi:HK97-gp10 family putative phage morphogenesis protein [Cytobacillus horneckiae]|uniref:HK97-gp10 family putative phage morphogenesis protein n=1 Tax=Cytobacillus horneckiae TaxID=549687 RepID=UPI003D9A8D23
MARRDISIGIEMAGMRQFERTLARFERDFINEVKRIIAETAEMIKSQAQALAPVDDDNLMESIGVYYYKRGLAAEIIVGAHYGIYVEYGTGIYAEGPGGSRAKKIPWAYPHPDGKRDEKGNLIFIWTNGMKAQPYWAPAMEAGNRHFERELNRLGA